MSKVALLLILVSTLFMNSCSTEQEGRKQEEPLPEEKLKSLLIGRWELKEEFDFMEKNPKIRSIYVFFKGGVVAHGEEVEWNEEVELPIMEYGNWQVIDDDKIQITFPQKTRILIIVHYPDDSISFNNWDIRGETPYNPYHYKKIE